MGPTPNFPRPLLNRALQTIWVLNKWQIRPLSVCVNIPAAAERECQNPLVSDPQPLRAYVNVALAIVGDAWVYCITDFRHKMWIPVWTWSINLTRSDASWYRFDKYMFYCTIRPMKCLSTANVVRHAQVLFHKLPCNLYHTKELDVRCALSWM